MGPKEVPTMTTLGVHIRGYAAQAGTDISDDQKIAESLQARGFDVDYNKKIIPMIILATCERTSTKKEYHE